MRRLCEYNDGEFVDKRFFTWVEKKNQFTMYLLIGYENYNCNWYDLCSTGFALSQRYDKVARARRNIVHVLRFSIDFFFHFTTATCFMPVYLAQFNYYTSLHSPSSFVYTKEKTNCEVVTCNFLEIVILELVHFHNRNS